VNLETTEEKAKEVLRLLGNINGDVWSVYWPSSNPEKVAVTVRLTPEQKELVDAAVLDSGVSVTVKHANLQALVDRESFELAALADRDKEDPSSPDWHKSYHRPEGVLKYYSYLAKTYPHLVTLVPSIGKTHEGRDLFAVHLSSNGTTKKEKKRVWWQSQIHAREWISGATTQFIFGKLISEFEKGTEEVVELLEGVEVVLIPIGGFVLVCGGGGSVQGLILSRVWLGSRFSDVNLSSNPPSTSNQSIPMAMPIRGVAAGCGEKTGAQDRSEVSGWTLTGEPNPSTSSP
jgi:hypothetical protein